MKKYNEKQKARLLLGCALILMLLFVVLIVLLMFVDYRAIDIGGQASHIGLYGINHGIFEGLNIPSNTAHVFDILSDVFLYLSFALVAAIGILILIKIIKKKSLKVLDPSFVIFALGGVALIFTWVIFNFCVINFRPVLVNAELESSFPSTHVMFVTYICLSIAFLVSRALDKKEKAEEEETRYNKIKLFFGLAMLFVILIEVITRLLSNMHWFSDIIGGLIVGTSIFFVLLSVSKFVEIKTKNKETITEGEE